MHVGGWTGEQVGWQAGRFVPRLLFTQRRRKESLVHTTHTRQVPLVTCMLLCYTNNMETSVYLPLRQNEKQDYFDDNGLRCFIQDNQQTSKGKITCCSV